VESRSYSYSRQGEQNVLSRPTDVTDASALGVWQTGQKLQVCLSVVVSRAKVSIKVIDWIAEQTSETFRTTGRMTVVVQDNGFAYEPP